MHQSQLSKNQSIETDRPAPLLPGFYSMQALSHGGVLPNITQYHRKPEPAVEWKDKLTKKRLFDAYALCSSESRWDVFTASGKSAGTRTAIASKEGVFMEVNRAVAVDYPAYVESIQDILGKDVCCITCAEHHSHASSVGHSNMVVIARQLVMDADDSDLHHIYLADSVESGCRVQGWFFDTQKVSQKLMNKFLDRFKWLSRGWALANDHHMQVLAYRMATLRPMQVMEIMLAVADLVSLGEHKSLVAMRIQHAQPEILIMFTAKMLDGMESAVLIKSPQDLEIIDRDALDQHAARIAALYKDAFL